MRIDLCINCLELGAQPIPVGHDKGTQRDPYRETVHLCSVCEEALLNGHFDTLSTRYRLSRRVVRGE